MNGPHQYCIRIAVEDLHYLRPAGGDLARAYAMWLITPYYIVTNAEEIQVHLFRGAMQPDVRLMSFKRSDLRRHWATLYESINKAAVIDYKQKLRKVLADSMQG